jgi:hypothetical protein
MAYVKIHPRKNADKRIRYMLSHQLPGDPSDSEQCTPEADAASAEFKAVRDMHPNSRRKIEAYEIYQAWSPEESKRLTKDEVNQMGHALVEKYFAGHQFLVVTHSDRPHLHNHILVNAVNMETGRSIPNKKEHLYRLRERSDEICRAKGLSIPNQVAADRKARTPEKVQRMQKFRGHSFVLDMMEKADFARKYATGYDQYKAVLLEFGIGVQIENKNITYFYPGQSHGKRGSKMGKDYHKPSLEKAFRENDQMFQKKPEAIAAFRGEIAVMHLKKGESLKVAVSPRREEKDYGAFTKSVRGEGKYQYPSEAGIKDSIIPLGEIQRAKQVSILDYCKRNRISLSANKKGETVLKGREHAVLSDYEWVNTKNKTRGTIIEFVAAHHNTSFVKAIAKINNNSRLLLLEQHFGEKERSYTSFYIPKPDRMEGPKATEHLARLLQSHGVRPELSKGLLEGNQAQVAKNGLIRFFSPDDASGALEYEPKSQGSWSKKAVGVYRKPFVSKQGTGSQAMVFFEPMHAMREKPFRLFSPQKNHDGILVLWEPSHKMIDPFVAANPHLTELFFVPLNGKKPTQPEIDFFGILGRRYAKHNVQVRMFDPERGMSRPGPELSL